MVAAYLRACILFTLCSLAVLCRVALSAERGVRAGYLSLPLAQAAIESRAKPDAGSTDNPPDHLRVDVPLVLIPVHVTTPLGASVTSLKKKNFRLLEDNIEQKIAHFVREDAPLSVGLVFDSSGSMRNKMRKSWEAAEEFLKTTNPEDEFFLIEFNERPKLAVSFTRDPKQVHRRLARTKPLGRTSLLDAIYLALSQMKNARHLRKAIVILSDGGDNHSRYTESQIKEAVREGDVQIYAMGIFDPDDSPKRTPEERNGPHLLGELAGETGGRHIPVENLDDLPAVCTRIGNELRNQYLLGYSPSNAAPDGKFRRVQVIVTAPEEMPPLRAHHRLGYYAPAR